MEPLTTRNPRARIFPVAHVDTFYERFREEMEKAMEWADTVMLENTEGGHWHENKFYRNLGVMADKKGKRIVSPDPNTITGHTIDTYIATTGGAILAAHGMAKLKGVPSRRAFLGQSLKALCGLSIAANTIPSLRFRYETLGDDVTEHTFQDTMTPSFQDYRNVTFAVHLDEMAPQFGNTILYVGFTHSDHVKHYIDNPATLTMKKAMYLPLKRRLVEY